MIKEDEHIIYVTEADVVAYIKKDQSKEVKNAGFTVKKIVVTTQRLLIFESLANRLQETEYELTTTIAKKPGKTPLLPERRPRISVNGFPEMAVDTLGLESKVIIEEEPTFYKFMQKQGIQNLVKSVVGIVLLKMPKKLRYYILSMGSISNAIRFAKAIICSQSWRKYTSFCKEMKTDLNPQWVRILTEVVYNDESVVLVDPDLFVTGSSQEIQTFIFLVTIIPFAHCYHHRYSVTTPEAAAYAADFISSIEGKIHSLSFSEAHINNSNLKLILPKVTLASLLKLDLSHNSLDDEVFDTLHRLIKAGSKRISYINISHNLIRLANPQLLVQLLKVASTILNLNISHNMIDDSSTETIEKFVIFAFNPPLEELNLSHNKFSRKIAWRLYVGNIRNFKSHPYLRFILYPIPLKRQIFGQFEVDFPRHNTTINLNMHSALVQQFEQQSLLKHTFIDMPATAKEAVTISFHRVLASNVKLPMNRQELNRTLQISHKIQNFIYAVQPVEKIYDMAMELKNFPFEVPPISRSHFIRYLYEKFNEALFIRDHYSVKYLFKALNELGVSVEGYADRLERLKQRDTIYAKRAESILNLEVDEGKINDELDELVREGLRLYLQGHGVEILYYLKYKRDQYIQKYLHEKLNPEHYLFDLMAKKNISADQRISEKEFIVPYEIRLEKKINENFYLHPWQANYQALSEMKAATFQACLQFLEQSEKKQKFALYFDRIEERIEFIKNEFTYFSYNKFKASYSDLKINPCRLVYLYNNIKDTSLYLQIPIYVKKRLITPEKNAIILNKEWFRKEYHIVEYPNINLRARKANFYNYEGVICRYESQIFHTEVRKILPTLNHILHAIEVAASTRVSMEKLLPSLIEYIKYLIDTIRHSLVPEQLKQELYLHLIAWRKGRYGNNTEVIHLLPAFTMYLKPPLPIQKYLVAAILQNQNVDLSDVPLCLATNPNEPTSDNVSLLESEFVERDWIPHDKTYCELFEKKGRVTLQLELLEKTRIILSVAESKTVAELMELVVDCVEMVAEDKQHFWLYKFNKQTQQIIAYESREHVGQILADFDKENMLLVKRRLYSRELRYNYSRYGQNMINSLYHDIKYEYMCRNFFINDKLASQIASLIFVIECVQNSMANMEAALAKVKTKFEGESQMDKIIYDRTAQLESNFFAYVPRKVYTRLLKSKQGFVAQLKAKISERCLKKEHNAIFEMKLAFIKVFSKFPEFMSSNYRVRSKEKGEMRLSINSMFLYVENDIESEYIHLEKLVSVVPKSKYLLVYYHKQENLVAQLPMFAEEKMIFSITMDILAYCSLRLKMSSINLYEIYHIEELEVRIVNHQNSLKRVYDKAIEKDLQKCRQDYEQSLRKVTKMSLTLMQFRQLQYYNKNHYIKSQINRKLYANKSERKLDFDRDIDEDEQNEISAANKKIMQMIFPTFNLVPEEEERPRERMTQQKFTDPNDSIDFRKEYDKLNFETTLKKEDAGRTPPDQPSPYSQPPQYSQPPNEMPPLTPIKKQEPNPDEVITAAKRGAPRPRGNRRRE